MHRLSGSALCGLTKYGGTYTTEGIAKLCEALPQSSLTHLECASSLSDSQPNSVSTL